MKPQNLKSERLKEVRRILKRQREIYKELRNLGYRKLEKPIRHGWFKEIVITQNVERYKNRAAIEELFNKVERAYWGRTKELAERKWGNRMSKHLIYKDFPTLSKKQFNKLSEPSKAMCTSFYYRNEAKKLKLRFYIRIPKGTYRIKFTRAYVTHSKRIDPNLLSEDSFLENKLLRSGYYEIIRKIYNWKYYDETEVKRKRRKVKSQMKALKQHSIEKLIKEEISWERS